MYWGVFHTFVYYQLGLIVVFICTRVIIYYNVATKSDVSVHRITSSRISFKLRRRLIGKITETLLAIVSHNYTQSPVISRSHSFGSCYNKIFFRFAGHARLLAYKPWSTSVTNRTRHGRPKQWPSRLLAKRCWTWRVWTASKPKYLWLDWDAITWRSWSLASRWG